MSYYDVIVFEEYEKDGQKKTFSHKVGKAFEGKDGKSLHVVLPQGISLSGRFSLFPKKDKGKSKDEPDVWDEETGECEACQL